MIISMRTSRSLFALTILSLLLGSGCWSKDFREPEVAEKVRRKDVSDFFSRNFPDVWDATMTALTDKKYAVSVTKRDQGMIVTDWVLGQSDRLFSGYGDTRIAYKVRFKLTLNLSLSRGGVRMKIRNTEQYISDSITFGSDFKGSLYQWIDTPSSGTKEKELLALIEEQLELSAPSRKK